MWLCFHNDMDNLHNANTLLHLFSHFSLTHYHKTLRRRTCIVTTRFIPVTFCTVILVPLPVLLFSCFYLESCSLHLQAAPGVWIQTMWYVNPCPSNHLKLKLRLFKLNPAVCYYAIIVIIVILHSYASLWLDCGLRCRRHLSFSFLVKSAVRNVNVIFHLSGR